MSYPAQFPLALRQMRQSQTLAISNPVGARLLSAVASPGDSGQANKNHGKTNSSPANAWQRQPGWLRKGLIPILLLSTLPSAGVGALLALLAAGSEFSITALISVILLIGIVKKNAIPMIDFAISAERDHGKSAHDAIFDARMLRFRSIMMTKMAALLGAIPLAIGYGDGLNCAVRRAFQLLEA